MTREEAIEILSVRDNYGKPIVWQKGFAEAYDMAVEALKATQWIPFRQEQNPDTGLWEWVEPLPQNGQHILVSISIDGHEPVQDDYIYKDGFSCWLDSGYEIGVDAVAWMSLPEPYKED